MAGRWPTIGEIEANANSAQARENHALWADQQRPMPPEDGERDKDQGKG